MKSGTKCHRQTYWTATASKKNNTFSKFIFPLALCLEQLLPLTFWLKALLCCLRSLTSLIIPSIYFEMALSSPCSLLQSFSPFASNMTPKLSYVMLLHVTPCNLSLFFTKSNPVAHPGKEKYPPFKGRLASPPLLKGMWYKIKSIQIKTAEKGCSWEREIMFLILYCHCCMFYDSQFSPRIC